MADKGQGSDDEWRSLVEKHWNGAGNGHLERFLPSIHYFIASDRDRGRDDAWRSLVENAWSNAGSGRRAEEAAPSAAGKRPSDAGGERRVEETASPAQALPEAVAAQCSASAPSLIEIDDEDEEEEEWDEMEVDGTAASANAEEGGAGDAVQIDAGAEAVAGLGESQDPVNGTVEADAMPSLKGPPVKAAVDTSKDVAMRAAPAPVAEAPTSTAKAAEAARKVAASREAARKLEASREAAKKLAASREAAKKPAVLQEAAKRPAVAHAVPKKPGALPKTVPAVSAAAAPGPKPKAPAVTDSGKSEEAARHYLVDNSALKAKTQGLGYRFSKRVSDIDKTATASWGSSVVGCDEGDGWLRVGTKYLPMKVGDKVVITPKVALARTTSGTLFVPAAVAPPSTPKPAGVFLQRTNSFDAGTPPGGGPRPAGVFIQRSGSFDGGQQGLGLRRQGSFNGGPAPAALFVPRSGGGGLKRQASEPLGVDPQKAAKGEGPLAATDPEGRRYDLNVVVVNFANVGATYACKVLGRDKARGDRLFDWEGVRRCLRHLREGLGLECIGVVMENFWAPDNSKDYKIGIPEDVRALCESIEETPRLQGKNHKSCDDEMTIKCAYRRNCRFLDNDNYRDWIKEMRNDRCRTWLGKCQELLQMRYFFDSQLGTFDTIDGKIPAGMLESSKPQ